MWLRWHKIGHVTWSERYVKRIKFTQLTHGEGYYCIEKILTRVTRVTTNFLWKLTTGLLAAKKEKGKPTDSIRFIT